jgi:hydantoinase/carbamoylase family amidase
MDRTGEDNHMSSISKVAAAVDMERVRTNLQTLFELGHEPGREGAWRLAFSPGDRRGRDFVLDLMRSAGLAPRVDQAGNLIGTVRGAGNDHGALIMGSHIDTVPGGGMFDGALGVIGGIEVARAMADAGYSCRHPVEVIAFSNEEKARFQSVLSGATAMVRGVEPEELAATKDAEGVLMTDAMHAMGLDPAAVAGARRQSGFCRAYLELHIEQGARLAKAGIPIGIVTAIVGISRARLVLRGRANHAGTTMMEDRRDALWGAADIVAQVRRAAMGEGGELVGTVGELRVHPGAANVVPGQVDLIIELRSADEGRMARVLEELLEKASEIAASYNLTLESDARHAGRAVPMDGAVQDAIERAAADLSLPSRRLVSWAGHDASSFAPVAPTGMIFVPSLQGVSHAPDEETTWEHAAAGIRVLASTVCRLDGDGGAAGGQA